MTLARYTYFFIHTGTMPDDKNITEEAKQEILASESEGMKLNFEEVSKQFETFALKRRRVVQYMPEDQIEGDSVSFFVREFSPQQHAGLTKVIRKLAKSFVKMQSTMRASSEVKQHIDTAAASDSEEEKEAAVNATMMAATESMLRNVEAILELVDEHTEDVFKLIVSSTYSDRECTKTIEQDDIANIGELIELLMALWFVNWHKGAAKKALGKLGLIRSKS